MFISTGNGLTTDCSIGSYKRGNQSDNIKSPTNTNTNTNKDNNKAINTNQINNTNSTNKNIANSTSATTKTVYWTPKGKSYHTTKSCSALANSKTILSGTQAESGKSDPCDRCH